MTIGKYYLTFGYEIDSSAYMDFMDYKVENITDEMRRLCKEEEDHSEDEYVLQYWFSQDMYKDSVWRVSYTFLINGVEFVVRGYTHDYDQNQENKKTDKSNVLVVGINIGTIDRWSGEVTLTGNNNKNLSILTTDPRWRVFLENYGKSTHHGVCEYKILSKGHNPEDGWYLLPFLYTTTDDCDCCS